MFSAWLVGLGAVCLLAVAAWAFSLLKGDVSIVDSLWSLFFLLAAMAYSFASDGYSAREQLALILCGVWALRLSGYITWRNWGEEEDYRYARMRENNSPNFAFKSLYIVFGLQAVLAWFISLPLLAATHGPGTLGALDFLACLLWLVGFTFEAGGDLQLARFKANPGNKGKVLDTGFWRYTRHPNYFGDFCVWWSFFLFALAAGGWWSVLGPVVMTILLLKVSGVAMLEKDIGERRPAYADYVARTSAFFPMPPRASTS